VADRTPPLPNARAGPARLSGFGVGGRLTAHAGPVNTGPGDGQELAFLIGGWTGLSSDGTICGTDRAARGTPPAIGLGRPPRQSRCRLDRSVSVPPGTRRTSSEGRDDGGGGAL
jgi:hypothetical protein